MSVRVTYFHPASFFILVYFLLLFFTLDITSFSFLVLNIKIRSFGGFFWKRLISSLFFFQWFPCSPDVRWRRWWDGISFFYFSWILIRSWNPFMPILKNQEVEAGLGSLGEENEPNSRGRISNLTRVDSKKVILSVITIMGFSLSRGDYDVLFSFFSGYQMKERKNKSGGYDDHDQENDGFGETEE